ncbi:MAG: hypothetical protein WBP81_30340 [Solirubrobacteraceae bacterium]
MRRVLLGVGLVFAVLPAGSALADATIGQTGGGPSCQPGSGAVYGDPTYVVPSGGGTITSFSFRSDTTDSGDTLDFLVLRPTGGGSYTVVGETGLFTLAGNGTVEKFPANIPVQAGDIIGFWAWTQTGTFTNCLRYASGSSIFESFSNVPPSVGDTVTFEFGIAPVDLNESANLVTLPTRKAQCKNGGWKSFGASFKNQGDCMSFVATGGKNPPSGS